VGDLLQVKGSGLEEDMIAYICSEALKVGGAMLWEDTNEVSGSHRAIAVDRLQRMYQIWHSCAVVTPWPPCTNDCHLHFNMRHAQVPACLWPPTRYRASRAASKQVLDHMS
jgi:hypothetical protein